MTSSLSPAVRRLIAATLVNTLGNGVYAAVGALYLTRAVGLSVGHVGVGLTVAALVGLVASTPLGVVADRLGPNRAYVGFLLLQALTMTPRWIISVLLVLNLLVAALVHVLGEMLQSAGGWGISFELASPGAQGQYQGAYAMGHQIGDLVAPLLITTVAVSWGWPGWLLTAAVFLVAGLFVPVVVQEPEPVMQPAV